MVGAPLVSVQYDGPRLVDTYLTPDQIPLISIGSPADITYDSGKGLVLHGKVSVIGSTYEYPPTSFPTNVVHMTRTTKVTITLDSGSRVPPGTPVDVSIHENSNG
jgi:multidrug resistance efflux pump